MQGEAIFWPVLVQAGLTYGVYALGSRRRLAAVGRRARPNPASSKFPDRR